MIELILQGFGARRYDGLTAALQCRQQVREGLPCASAGLDQEFVEVRYRLGDGFRHPCLSRSWLEAGQQLFEWAMFAKEFGEVCHRAKVTRFDLFWQEPNGRIL